MSKVDSAELSDPRFSAEALTKRYFGNSSLAVAQESGRGRFVVCTKAIKAGSKICDALPYVYSIEDELKTIACAHCLKPSIESMAAVFSQTIASVDAVIINERLEAGENIHEIEREMEEQRIAREQPLGDSADDVPFADAFENMESNYGASTDTSSGQSPSPSPITNWTISCDACQMVYYCSEACKVENTHFHQLMCPSLTKLRHMSWVYADVTMARMVIAIMARRFLENESEAGNIDKNEYLASVVGGKQHCSGDSVARDESSRFEFDVMSLVSNEAQILQKTLSRRRSLVSFLNKIPTRDERLTLGDSNRMVSLIGKIDQNTFGVRYDRNLSYAFALVPAMSYFNHSCAPNVCVIQHNTVVNIYALRDIEVGEEVAISYIETNRPTKDRRRCLQAEYNFYCRCSRCNAAPVENASYDDFVERYCCKTKSCDGKGLLIPLVDTEEDLAQELRACNICQSTKIIKR